MWGYPANIPPSSLLHRKSLAKVKFMIYTEFASNLSFRLFRAGKKSPFFGTLSSISYQFVLGKSVGTKWLKIPWVVIPVPVRFRSAALIKSEGNVEFTAFPLFFVKNVWTLYDEISSFEKQVCHSFLCWHFVGSEVLWLQIYQGQILRDIVEMNFRDWTGT